MVAKIKEPLDVRKAVYYNENKIKEKVAECIFAKNFIKEYDQLSIRDKLQRFQQVNSLNKSISRNTLHISLSFDPSEELSNALLIKIAQEYMAGIGFADQPYIVYQHHDTAHSHMHVVTTTIRQDGSSIDLHNIGKDKSEPIRKAIERKYDLIRAEGRNKGQQQDIRPLKVQKLQYGKTETKRGITNVLEAVVKAYKCSSLPELNAVLSLYNVWANKGAPGSRLDKTGGLLYHLLNDQKKPVGVPVKASSIYFKPTLTYLEARFKANEKKDPADIRRIKGAIDWVLSDPPATLEEFAQRLKEEQIHTVLRTNQQGLTYGITFVDTRNKSVINGSDIDKHYSAQKILGKIGQDRQLQLFPIQKQSAAKDNPSTSSNQKETSPGSQDQASSSPSQSPYSKAENQQNIAFPSDPGQDLLTRPEEEYEHTPAELKKDKKKKKNRSPQH